MTQDKDLLLKYLCMALPYRTAIRDDYGDITFLDYNDVHIQNYFEGIVEGVVRPYLRSMSSMTEEERKEYKHLVAFSGSPDGAANFIDWLLENHFDFMGLIPKGLAIEVTKDNNPYETCDTSMHETPMINPIMQYEQAYMYYKYLSQQMDYKIKCKEFENLQNRK